MTETRQQWEDRKELEYRREASKFYRGFWVVILWIGFLFLIAVSAARSQTPQQQFADGRAAVLEDWKDQAMAIQNVELGFICHIINGFERAKAVDTVQQVMWKEMFRWGGRWDDDDIALLHRYTSAAKVLAKQDADDGFCARLTPADRGRFRVLINGLLH